MKLLLLVLASTAFLATASRVHRQSQFPTVVACDEGSSTHVVNPGPDRIPTIVRSHQIWSVYDRSNYTNDVDCAVEFIAEEPLLYSLQFRYFDLEYEPTCEYDSLCIRGDIYCRDTLKNASMAYHVPAGQPLILYFHTDDSDTGRGFEVHVEVRPSLGDSSQEHIEQCNPYVYSTTDDYYQYEDDQDMPDDAPAEYDEYDYYNDK